MCFKMSEERKKNKTYKKWQNRADYLFWQGYGDCDKISKLLIKEMEADGLTLGKEFVVVRGVVAGTNHMCLEMYGHDAVYQDGDNLYHKLNGYRLDATTDLPFDYIGFKGAYGTY